ncbi:MAG: hypothetical protein BGO97_08085 [Micrococcales bacterium 70-64]|nr:hypothetical protein [Leifsonia sp.]ODU63989.1 MAG: hypothetical protein ABT06_08090 [Leifsonia sp. SCN 70-46]OJX87179.1 MAG: hypothetical protein BGO97_08085 [Micrococcales bacterium 70-64]
MSTFRNPVGPQSSRVYWRRRLVVLLGLLAVILIVVLIVVRPGSGATTPSPKPSSSAGAPSGNPTDAATPPECDPTKVTVDAATDSTSYEAGVNPVLSFTLKSLSDCTMSVGSDVQEFTITSGDELIWTSKDCQTAPVPATIVLKAGVPQAGPSITWDRTRSSADTCDSTRDAVIAGGASYHLTVTVGESTSKNDRQFLLY